MTAFMPTSPSKFPLSRPQAVEALPDGGTEVTVVTTEAERQGLAEINGLIALKSLQATFTMKPERSGSVHVSGFVEAQVTQNCIVSLDPFDAEIREPVDVVFMPDKGIEAWLAGQKAKRIDDPSSEEEDPPEPIIAGQIDLGQLAAEILALGIDPYPRKPGVTFDESLYSADKDPSPFAALARLKTDG